jgi:histidinol-phosphate aminotransferase
MGVKPYGAPHPEVPNPLNVNENPYPPPPDVVQSIQRRLGRAAQGLNRYPDRDFGELRQALAAYVQKQAGGPGGSSDSSDAGGPGEPGRQDQDQNQGQPAGPGPAQAQTAPNSLAFITPDHVWAANGSNEVMLHLFQAFGGPGRAALSWDPTYSMYPEYARDSHTVWITGQRLADFTIDVAAGIEQLKSERPTLVLLANPNNPTGTAVPQAAIEQLAQATAGQAVLVIDEAYAEFRRPDREGRQPTSLGLVASHPHVVVTRTMSKAFAFAGVRLGYAIAQPELIQYLRTVRLPYHLSTVTQQVALAGLDHADQMLAQVADLRQGRDRLAAALTQAGYDVPASDANFLLVGQFPDRHAVWQGLLDRGVLVREVGPEHYLRVSVGTPSQNQAFLAALAKVAPHPEGAAWTAKPN